MPRLNAIGIVVSDLATAVDSYRRLGLDFPDVGQEEVHAEAAGPGGIRVILDTEAAMRSYSDWQPPTGGSPRSAIKFLCDSVGEVDRFFAELVAGGWAPIIEPFDASWGQRYATVHDHDGNAVDLFAPL